jgi:hypothetical protein
LYIRGFYFWLPALAAVLVCGLLGYAFGFSFPKVLLFTVLFWLPVETFLALVLTSASNPKIEESPPSSLDLFPRR